MSDNTTELPDGSTIHHIDIDPKVLGILKFRAKRWYKKLAKRKRKRYYEFIPPDMERGSLEAIVAMYTGYILTEKADKILSDAANL